METPDQGGYFYIRFVLNTLKLDIRKMILVRFGPEDIFSIEESTDGWELFVARVHPENYPAIFNLISNNCLSIARVDAKVFLDEFLKQAESLRNIEMSSSKDSKTPLKDLHQRVQVNIFARMIAQENGLSDGFIQNSYDKSKKAADYFIEQKMKEQNL